MKNNVVACIGIAALLLALLALLKQCQEEELAVAPSPPPTMVRFINKTERGVVIEIDDIEMEMQPSDATKPPVTLTNTVVGANHNMTPKGGGNDVVNANLDQGNPADWGKTYRLQAKIVLTGVVHDFEPELIIATTDDFKYSFKVKMTQTAKTVEGVPGIEYTVTIHAKYVDAAGNQQPEVSESATHFVSN